MRTSGSSLKGATLFKAISAFEELEMLSQEEQLEEAVGERVEASQALQRKSSRRRLQIFLGL